MRERIQMIDIKRELEDIGTNIESAVRESFGSTAFINGPRVKAFEKDVAEYLGVKHAIGVANGTDALHLALLSSGIGPDDEVITTPFTFFATAEACAYVGAKPVFVDIDESTFNINPSLVQAAVTPRTKAILPVHLFGLPSDMDALSNIATDNNLTIIEDCAQSFGSKYKGKATGSIGDVGAFSFYPTKNLGAYGDAGMVTTNNDEIAEKCFIYREHGSSKRYYHKYIGYNSRLDDIQAAVLGVKLQHIDRFNTRRIAIASIYQESLGKSVVTQVATEGATHVYHQFTIRVSNRDEVIAALDKENIASSIFYPVCCHLQEAMMYLKYKEGSMPVAEKVSAEVLSLPINPYLNDDEAILIADIVKSVAKKPL